MIAGVYCNRLKIGMKLDADPTVIYPITKGKPLGRRILRSELAADNGYNTYRRPGLPPARSPIRGARASPRCSTRPRPRRSISSPTAPAAMSFADDLRASISANVDKWYRDSPCQRGKCEQPRDFPRPAVHRQSDPVRGGDRLVDRDHDEPARHHHRRRRRNMSATIGRDLPAQERDRDACCCRRSPLICCFRAAAPTIAAATWLIVRGAGAARPHQHLPADLAANGRCCASCRAVGRHVADSALVAGIAPRPAAAVVEQGERRSRRTAGQSLRRFASGAAAQGCRVSRSRAPPASA